MAIINLVDRVLPGKESIRKDFNIFILSLGFFLLFMAFFTMGNIQTVILESAKNPNSTGYVEDFNGDGFISLSIVYAVAFFCDFFSASIIALLGVKATLCTGACAYAIFIASFFLLESWALYTASALMGVGSAMVWVSQGTVLSQNSDPYTIDRNTGFFYVAMTGSGLIGNIFSYYQFRDDMGIEEDTRFVFVSGLFIVAGLGIVVFLFMLPMPWAANSKAESPTQSFIKSMKLFATREIQLLICFFIYDGLEFTHYAGVMGTSLSFSESFNRDDNSMAGLHGIVVHTGQVIIGLVFGFLGGFIRKFPRYPFMILCLICHFTSYTLTLVNVPGDAPLGETDDDPALIVPSNTGLAIFSSLVLGLGTGLLDTQAMGFLGLVYAHRASQAFAILKMFHHSMQSISYAYAGYLSLYWQVAILYLFGSLGGAGFIAVDIMTTRKLQRQRENDRKISVTNSLSVTAESCKI